MSVPTDPIKYAAFIEKCRERGRKHPPSKETLEKLRLINIGNKYNLGKTPWNKGLTTPEEVREKQRLAKLKHPAPNGFKKGTSREHIAILFRGKPIPKTSVLKRTISRYGNFWWYGNVTYEEDPKYCERFDESFKERVRAYWGYKCFECHIPQNGRKLAVHHVHYDKKMCCNGSPRDVVPLCWSCHMATNSHHKYWENHFTELLYLYHPDGKCYFTKEEMEQHSKSFAMGAKG